MRIVTNHAELDALQDGAVLHDERDAGPYSVWIKDAAMGWDDVVWWQGGSEIPSSTTEVPLPMRLIYEVES